MGKIHWHGMPHNSEVSGTAKMRLLVFYLILASKYLQAHIYIHIFEIFQIYIYISNSL